MKRLQKLAVFLLALFLLAASCPIPALAEGFAFNWDQDEENPDGPHCGSILLLNLDTDTVVYSLDPDKERPMASMTKIMSYIVAYETIPNIETTVITVPESVETELEGTGSSLAGVSVGEQLTGEQLLYLMMVPSGNDAALTLAKYVDSLYESGQLTLPEDPARSGGKEGAGSEASSEASEVSDSLSSQPAAPSEGEDADPEAGENGAEEPGGEGEEGQEEGENSGYAMDYTGKSYFVELMNRKAAELGCKHTHFTNPHGLHNPNHYSTARDMATITKYAMTLPHFTEITSTTSYLKPATNMDSEEQVKNTTNYMLTNYVDGYGMNYYYLYATGIKTGSLDEAGYCITASATADGYTYIAVLMGSPMYYEDGSENPIHGEMLDARSLFRWALLDLEKKTVAVQGDVISSVGLKYAWKKDELLLAAGSNASVMLPKSVDSNSILVTPDVPESVEAPIRKGEQIGTAVISYAGENIATIPLVASESVAKSEALQVWEQGQAVLTSPWFLVIMAVIAALIIVYIILIVLYRRKQRQLRRVKRFRDM